MQKAIHTCENIPQNKIKVTAHLDISYEETFSFRSLIQKI